jgi:hypothetical protein
MESFIVDINNFDSCRDAAENEKKIVNWAANQGYLELAQALREEQPQNEDILFEKGPFLGFWDPEKMQEQLKAISETFPKYLFKMVSCNFSEDPRNCYIMEAIDGRVAGYSATPGNDE